MSANPLGPFERVMPGEVTPDFSLRSTANQRIRSSDLLGHRLVLVFTGQPDDRRVRLLLAGLRATHRTIALEGGVVLLIAPVSAETGYLAEPGVPVPFPLLRDVAGIVHRQFGAVDGSDQPAPSLFLTDPCQRVVYRALCGFGERLPTAAQILAFLRFDRLTCPVCGATRQRTP